MGKTRIGLLSEQVINQIAAGEVIENPASVVKELLDNAVDSGATEITIEILAGGRQMVRVSDNGCGMVEEDALLSLQRHATSKIRNLDDITLTSTMGFRGEAVPSIASISKFTLLTCTAESSTGTLISVDGGKLVSCAPAVRSQGTTVEVKQLFFNVPVRKKFQRSPSYDAAEIHKMAMMHALAYPEISFDLIHNHKQLFKVGRGAQPISFCEELGRRIPELLGPEYFVGTMPLDHTAGEIALKGWIGLPTFTRHNRTGQHLFINRRYVTCPTVVYAISEAYGHALPAKRHPIFALHLTLPGSWVDVNVHPQKSQVRLRRQEEIKSAIFTAVEQALQCHQSGKESSCFEDTEDELPPSFGGISLPLPPIECEPLQVEPSTVSVEESADPKNPSTIAIPQRPAYEIHQREAPFQQPKNAPAQMMPQVSAEEPALFASEPKKQAPRVLTTLAGYLLLAGRGDALHLVDQRAAHSRILYEALEGRRERRIASQTLLLPIALELPPHEAECLIDYLPMLAGIGIEVEEFGGQTFLVRAMPQIWQELCPKSFIPELLSQLQSGSASKRHDDEMKKRVASCSARVAVSRRAKLSIEEGQHLVDELYACAFPDRCPHGKPTMLRLSGDEIAKVFQQQVRYFS